jgi:hypothetical protein
MRRPRGFVVGIDLLDVQRRALPLRLTKSGRAPTRRSTGAE